MTAALAFAKPALARNFAEYSPSDLSKGLGSVCHQSSTRSLHPQISDGERAVSYTTEARTFRDRAPIDEIDDRGFARIVSGALQAHYGPMKASAKCIANDAGSSVQSAKNWLSGVVVPSAIYLKRLERKVPGLAAEMRRLQAMESASDPDFERELSELVRRIQAYERV